MGGGILKHPTLIDKVREELVDLLGGYLQNDVYRADIHTHIVPPSLGDMAGVYGAMGLAMRDV